MGTNLLFRHGKVRTRRDTAGRVLVPSQDEPLSEEGIKGARGVVNHLNRHNILVAQIITSPTERASQFAGLIRLGLEVPLYVRDDRLRCLAQPPPEWEGQPKEEWEQTSGVRVKPPSQERIDDLQDILKELTEGGDDGGTLLVTHGYPARIILFLLDQGTAPLERIPTLDETKALYPLDRSEGWAFEKDSSGLLVRKEKIRLKSGSDIENHNSHSFKEHG